MTKKEIEIITNIIGAVESGGQIYGKRDYGAYAGKRAGSPNERTVTLGWAQNYGNEARKLCQMIFDKDPQSFRTIDITGVEQMLKKDWVSVGWNPNNTEKRVLIDLITSKAGKEAQDELFGQLIVKYIADAKAVGVDSVPAQMMWCEIEHLGGYGPAKRIFSRAEKPYTPESIYKSLLIDQKDKSNDYQVGDEIYQTRHECCVRWINQYVVEAYGSAQEELEENEISEDMILPLSIHPAADKAAKQMEDWCVDDSHGYDQIYRWGEKGDYDCSAGLIQAYENAGIHVKKMGATYTGNMKSVFRKAGFVEVPKSKVNWKTGDGLLRGDVLLNEAHHTAIYCGGGMEAEFSVNEKGTATGGRPGDQTGRETLIRPLRNYPWDCVLRLQATEDKQDSPEKNGAGAYIFAPETVQYGYSGPSVLLLQRLLRGMGYRDADQKTLKRDGDFGKATDYALRCLQEKMKIEIDGICGPVTWKKIIGL